MARGTPQGEGVGWMKSARKTATHLRKRLLDPKDTQAGFLVCALLVFHEVLLTSLITSKVGYTEIDWEAYMQQVEAFDSGERNYMKIKGGTGPLVYPAGFLYVYSWLKKATGGDVAAAQPLFAVIYTVNLSVVLNVIVNARIMPPIALGLLTLSKRLHSIYVLRLFNDCVAMLPVHMAILVAQAGRWELAALLWSAAVGVKMNALLFAPALALLMLRAAPLWRCLLCAALAAGVQLALAVPFLEYRSEYLARAFEFGRQFQYKWSVNWQFVPEQTFLGNKWSTALLFWHLIILLWLVDKRWMADAGGVRGLVRLALSRLGGSRPDPSASRLAPGYVASVLWECNLVGIAFARSLHYQFYSWYGFSLPYLAWQTRFPALYKFCWNVYPPNKLYSMLLGECHVILLVAIINGAPLRVHPPKDPLLEGGAAFGRRPGAAAPAAPAAPTGKTAQLLAELEGEKKGAGPAETTPAKEGKKDK